MILQVYNVRVSKSKTNVLATLPSWIHNYYTINKFYIQSHVGNTVQLHGTFAPRISGHNNGMNENKSRFPGINAQLYYRGGGYKSYDTCWYAFFCDGYKLLGSPVTLPHFIIDVSFNGQPFFFTNTVT